MTTAITCWGDSLTDGKGQTPYPVFLESLVPVSCDNRGVSAETSSQIRARMEADPATWPRPAVIWCGRNNLDIRNNPAQDAAGAVQTLEDVDAMISLLGHDRFLVIGVTSTTLEPAGSAKHSVRLKLNGALALIYGPRFIDMHRIITGLRDGTPQDAAAEVSGVLPPSLLIDTLHFNALGYALVAGIIAERSALLLGVPAASRGLPVRRAIFKAFFNL